MTRRYLADRRKRNRELAAQDAANRCSVCKRPFAEVGHVLEDFLLDGKYCSDDCLEQARESSITRKG